MDYPFVSEHWSTYQAIKKGFGLLLSEFEFRIGNYRKTLQRWILPGVEFLISTCGNNNGLEIRGWRLDQHKTK